MKRPLRKLIAFSSAAAVLTNLTVLTAHAAVTVTQISAQDFDSVIRYSDENVFLNDAAEGKPAELVVIGKDGKKKTLSLAEGISAVVPAYRALGGTPSAYGFDFRNPAFALALDKSGCLIAEINDSFKTAYALLDRSTGKQISKPYSHIQILTDKLFVVSVTKETTENGVATSKNIGGLISADGTEIFPPDEKYGRFCVTADGAHLLVDTLEGDFIADLTGKPVSETYDEIRFLRKDRSMYFANDYTADDRYYIFSTGESHPLEFSVLRFKNSAGKYALAFKGIEPETKWYDDIRLKERYVYLAEDFSYLNRQKYDEIAASMGKNASGEPTGSAEQYTDYFDLEGNKTAGYDVLHPITLHADGEAYHYLMINPTGDLDTNGYKGKATIFDMNEKVLLEGDEIVCCNSESGRFVMRTDNTYQLYSAKLERLGTYSEWGSILADGWYGRTGGKYVQFDKSLNIVNEKMQASLLEKERLSKMYLYNGRNPEDEQHVGYAVKDKENTLTWEIWDTNYVPHGTIILKPRHGGTLDETETKFTNAGADSKIPMLKAVLSETVTDAATGKNSYYDDTVYYYINSEYEILESENKNVEVYGNLFVAQDADGKKTVLDAKGKDITPAGYTDIQINSEETKGKYEYYITGIAADSFTVYDSSMKEKYTLKGKPVTENVYEKDGKYGFYLLSAGWRTDAVYTPAYEDGELRYFCPESPNTDHSSLKDRVYPMTDGKSLRFFDGWGNLFTEIDTSYAFPGGTQSNYDFGNLILNDKTADGKSRTYIYDAVHNEVTYKQTGTYDRITLAEGGCAVTINEPADGALWTSSLELAQGLIRTDGTVLVAPTKGLNITLTQKANEYTFDMKDAKKTDTVFARFDTRETNSGFLVPVDALAPEYAKKYGYAAAVKSEYDCYAVFKNGKWGLADKDGKALCEPKYDWICKFKDGLAWTFTFNEQGYWYMGVIDKYGKTVAAAEQKTDNDLELMFTDDAFYLNYKHAADNMEYYTHTVIQAEDHLNEFARKNGYQTAVRYGNLYLVMKDRLYGVVTAKNEPVIPIEFTDVLAFPADAHSMCNLSEAEKEILTKAPFTTPFTACENGTQLITFKTAAGKVRAYQITDDSAPVCTVQGDFDGDGVLKINDAVLMMRSIAEDSAADAKPAAGALTLADMDGDGELTILDVCALLQKLSQ